ncbi:MAG: GGDEF domain-containing protein [Pirellulales bacterium]
MAHNCPHAQIPVTAIWQVLEQSREGIAFVDPNDGSILWHNAAFQEACNSSGDLRRQDLTSVMAAPPPGSTDDGDMRLIESPAVTAVLVLRPSNRLPTEFCDPLTGLADRGQLVQRLQGLWAQSRPPFRRSLAAMFVDLNNFKHINDRWGHQIGDEALRQVARRLQGATRVDDFLARYGGDEFVLLLTGWQRPNEVQPVVDRLHDALKAPFKLGEYSVGISASIGVAYSTDDYASPQALLHAADRAMYASKLAQ